MTDPKPLRLIEATLYHYVAGARTEGAHEDLHGDCSGLRGDCTGLWGDCSSLEGNCTGLWGDLDGIPQSARPCNIADRVEPAGQEGQP